MTRGRTGAARSPDRRRLHPPPPRHSVHEQRAQAGRVWWRTSRLRVFGKAVKPRVKRERRWFQVYLAAAERLTHGKRNPVAAWLDELGVFGLRSHEKRVPHVCLRSADLGDRNLPPTPLGDRRMRLARWPSQEAVNVYYATSSPRLAARRADPAAPAGHQRPPDPRTTARRRDGPSSTSTVSGGTEIVRFLEIVGALGANKRRNASADPGALRRPARNPNRDLIPREAWRALVVPAMPEAGITSRQMQPLSTPGTAAPPSTRRLEQRAGDASRIGCALRGAGRPGPRRRLLGPDRLDRARRCRGGLRPHRSRACTTSSPTTSSSTTRSSRTPTSSPSSTARTTTAIPRTSRTGWPT